MIKAAASIAVVCLALIGCESTRTELTDIQKIEISKKDAQKAWEADVPSKEAVTQQNLCGDSESTLERSLIGITRTHKVFEFTCLRYISGTTMIHRKGTFKIPISKEQQ
ncbi:hypothetical protein [Vibrio sp. D431a]|uniref:hypothetical protein n=1 Tax=Vibrio sp. D431a TaxID=2837388 RepID=UPI002552CC3E|nr:hypothetical protein [Vibrio sp. D431a]MDK9790670.1 hypothetical protein [Vibrio sp. D431a]